MLVHQPNERLSDLLCEMMDERRGGKPRWSDFQFAVAWTNRSGAKKLEAALMRYIKAGGRVSCTVGLDFAGTTVEGLQILLDLQACAPREVKCFVYKNEWAGSTFHPKVYLFSNSVDATLIVGSNNLTGAGLASNVECSLMVSGGLAEDPFPNTQQLLKEWRSPGPLVRPLAPGLLKKLIALGYVQTEEDRAKLQAQQRAKTSVRKKEKLFGTVVSQTSATRRPPTSGSALQVRHGTSTEETVIFDVRPHRTTQIQIPKRLRESGFMLPAHTIKSFHDDQVRSILISTRAGKFNYYYFEAPEVSQHTTNRSLLNLYWQDDVLWYQAVDDTSPEGVAMIKTLAKGRATTPRTTHESKPGNPGTQSWLFLN